MKKCPTGKKTYDTHEVAEDALIESWVKYDHKSGTGPVAVYQCEECGYFHLTSKGIMNGRLAKYIAEGRIKLLKEAQRWEGKLRKK